MIKLKSIWAVFLICVFLASSSEAVSIKGILLSNIGDIVSTVTGSEFPEVQKHSLLLYERFTDHATERIFYQPRIFTIGTDGSMRKQSTFEVATEYNVTLSPTEYIVQKMSLAISDKRFGRRRNVMYTIPGEYAFYNPNLTSWNVYNLKTFETSGTEDGVDISDVGGDKRNRAYGDDRII